MKRTRITYAALIIAIIIAIAFALSVPHTKEAPRPSGTSSSAATSTPVVSVHDVYKKGIHTITGSLLLPNPCVVLTTSAEISGDASSTQSITISFTAPPDTGICLQLPQSVSYTATLPAPQGIPITAVFNGEAASTTLK